MTLEPRMLVAEERLQRLASGMPSPDVEAGWAALSAQLEPPLARVIPLRRRRFGRPIALAAAAALLVAGSALAAVTHAGVDRAAAPSVVVASDGGVWSGPRLHAPFSGPPARTTSTDPKGAAPPATHPSRAAPGGTSAAGGGVGNALDDPNDRDQGTGNDGRHDDHGGGNDGAEGSSPRGHGHDGTDPSAPSQAPTDHGHGGSDQSHGGGNGNGHGH